MGKPPLLSGKERDAESGLDYFGARYYGSALGRFTSPDEFRDLTVDPPTGRKIETNTALPFADIADPQTLNKYAYVRNNPLRYTDPDGHCIEDACVVEAATATAVGSAVLYYGYKLGVTIRETLNSQYQPVPAYASSRSDDTSKKGSPGLSQAADQTKALSPASPEGGNQDDKKAGTQDKKLSNSEVKTLENNTGQDVHDIKGDIVGNKNVSRYDLFKTQNGDIVVKPKGGTGTG
ncbi:MAG: polymorphic toxin type 33 domain-containing protein [Acidobacteriota bacterium]|nr:polymorphic toxin type 33 domain-containing protein [Acidobacteriota bacterium]